MEDLLASFEAEHDAIKAGRPFSRLRAPWAPMFKASQAAFDQLMHDSDAMHARLTDERGA